MRLYHGSNTGGIVILEPQLADHDKPYVYLTTIDVVALFYLCNAVERPYYWFPYGFSKSDFSTPIYEELYPNALREVSDGVHGYIYELDVDESQVIPFKNIPCARLATKPVQITSCKEVENAYELLLNYERLGKLKVSRFEEKTETQLDWWWNEICSYIKEKDMIDSPNCSYARFVREKFPHVWDKYIKSSSKPQ